MANSKQHATDWLRFLVAQDLPFSDALSNQVAIGMIGELCACGCQGFAFEVPEDANVLPLQAGAGVFYEVVVSSNFSEEIDLLLFTDDRGCLSWIDVTYGACNIEAMPEGIEPGPIVSIWPGTRKDLPTIEAVATQRQEKWWKFGSRH
ncbi:MULTISPECIES: hypothetical protein [unclassified Duganella]|jgi:hypothetical protein|uniref:hypothetical protein n=1 Tax=unclassified Duganella TaxID=2636909 RepID=UPI000B7CF39F|nr:MULTISPECIES: hypothetical protein [unclassified Duganella]